MRISHHHRRAHKTDDETHLRLKIIETQLEKLVEKNAVHNDTLQTVRNTNVRIENKADDQQRTLEILARREVTMDAEIATNIKDMREDMNHGNQLIFDKCKNIYERANGLLVTIICSIGICFTFTVAILNRIDATREGVINRLKDFGGGSGNNVICTTSHNYSVEHTLLFLFLLGLLFLLSYVAFSIIDRLVSWFPATYVFANDLCRAVQAGIVNFAVGIIIITIKFLRLNGSDFDLNKNWRGKKEILMINLMASLFVAGALICVYGKNTSDNRLHACVGYWETQLIFWAVIALKLLLGVSCLLFIVVEFLLICETALLD